jgi:hypothetical protein
MKKLITLILVLSAWNSFGQLTLVRDNKIDQKLTPFQLSNGKWMFYSTISTKKDKTSKVILFNSDFSIYKSIDIKQLFPYDTIVYTSNIISMTSVSNHNGTVQIRFNDNFFNTDSKVEFIISYYSFKNENSKMYYQQSSVILNEDGIEIQKFNNPIGQISFSFSDNFNVVYDNSSENYTPYSIKVYSIPGNLPCPSSCSQKAAGIAPITPPNEYKGIQVNSFPNPSSDKVTLAYTLPEGVSFGTLRLYSQTGELVKEFKVSNQVDHLELPVSEYTSGTYYYELQAGENTSGGKKIVIIN